MVDVFEDHRLDVTRPPFGEVERVVEGLHALEPHVERLVEHEHAEAIAGVEHRRAQRVVGAADGVEAGGLEELDAALVGSPDGRGAERAVVVVDAAPRSFTVSPLMRSPRTGSSRSVRMPSGTMAESISRSSSSNVAWIS